MPCRGAFEGKRVLDLFSGTGALGFEALSSGAREAVWVDSDGTQVEMIEKTISELGLHEAGRVICLDVFRALENLIRGEQRFDFIFLDPPYHQGLGQKALKLISQSGLVHEGSILVLETHKTEDPPETIGRLKSVKTKKHGDTKITFYLAS